MEGSLAIALYVLLYLVLLWIFFWVVRMAVRYGVDDALRRNRSWLGRRQEDRSAPER